MDSIISAFAPDLFSGKSVLVTGGTSGIGLSTAIAFRDLGAQVTAVGATQAEQKQASADGINRGISFAMLDVRDGPAVNALVGGLPAIDVVVNAAGAIRRDSEHDPEVFADILDINLNGMMRVLAAAKPKLEATQGCAVNVASILSFFGGPRVPGYSASKGGVAQLTKSLASAWATAGIRVNAVAPGWIATAMTEPLRESEETNRRILSRTPAGRWGKPEEIAAAIVFLASPAARFVTGSVLTVDGGYSAN